MIDWFDLLAVRGTLKSLLQHYSSEASILRCSAFFTLQLSHPYMTIGKIQLWLYGSLLAKWCLLFNMLSRFVIAFLLRSEHLLISWLQSPSAVIFGAQENKICRCFHIFPIYLPGTDGTRCQLFHSFFTLFQRFFSFVLIHFLPLEWYHLRLLIVLGCLIPACAYSSPAFLMMYSAEKLNNQGDNIQSWCTLFPIWNQSVVSMSSSNCCFLTCIQVSQEAGQVVW